MGASIIIYPQNIMEDGTVTVTGTADAGFPEARLWDRSIDLFWVDTVTEAKVYHVDYGSAVSCDTLIIDKHNFNGEDMQFQHSPDDAAWTDAVTDWTQGDNLQIAKAMAASASKRYWQVTVTSMSNPKCSEIFISLGYVFPVQASPNSSQADRANVQWNRTVGGLDRSTKFGVKRRVRNYSLWLSAAEQTSFSAAMVFLDDYSKPFYIKDHAGAYFLCRFIDVPVFDFNHKTHARIDVGIVEVL